MLAPSGLELRTGKHRFGFALFSRSREQITDASVAVYVAPAGGGPAEGPYLARWESLAVRPQFQSRQTASDPDSAKSIYTAEIPFAKPGQVQRCSASPASAASSCRPRPPRRESW